MAVGVIPVAAPAGAAESQVSALEFSRLVRTLAYEARHLGVQIPGFRSPPRIAATRTIRRYADGQAVVAIAIRGRERSAVWFDLVEGLVAANRLDAAAATRVRETLMPVLAGSSSAATSPHVPAHGMEMGRHAA